MGKHPPLARLAQDTTANVIAISAASLVPLLAMVGGAVEASRFYMADSRLQAACDAGALAARKAMGKDDWGEAHQTMAHNFFDQNFEHDMFGVEDLSRSFSGSEEGVVTGTATADLPTTVMGLFGYEDFQISVTCDADIHIPNTDIVFVLDVTGSMSNRVTDPTTGLRVSKISALREATLNFYDTVEAASDADTEVRYGIVPYSSGVHMGPVILAADRSWMANYHTYQSMKAQFRMVTSWEPTDEGLMFEDVNQIGGESYLEWRGFRESGHSPTSCLNVRPEGYDAVLPDGVELSDADETGVSMTGEQYRTVYFAFEDEMLERWVGSSTYLPSSNECAIGHQIFEYKADFTLHLREVFVETEEFVNYVFGPIGTAGSGEFYEWTNADLTDAYDDYIVDLPLGHEGAMISTWWEGCIEEAATDEGQSDFDPVPSAAKDLDIDLVPTTEEERWKPVLNWAFAKRKDSDGNFTTAVVTSDSGYYDFPDPACPKAARKLDPFTDRAELENYLSASNGFVADGYTYHDIGMIWGGRLISPDGIFGSDNQVGSNGRGITRHVVFMTDGQMSPEVLDTYTPYGVEFWDRRITDDGLEDTALANHETRFQVACKAIRDKNITVWVVAFGTSLTQNLIDCASSGRAYHASNSEELDAAFNEIAQNITQLRLTA